MNISIRKLFVLLAVVLSLVAVQAVWADTLTVTGTIERIGTSDDGSFGSIDVSSNNTIYTFYHISFTDLANNEINLQLGDTVTISSYKVTFPNGMVKNIAYSITVGDVTVTWKTKAPKAGPVETTIFSTTTTATTDCTCDNCYCNCPVDCLDCPCDCSCDCTCDGTGPNGPKGPKK